MAAGPGGAGEEAAAEKTEFDLVITDVDALPERLTRTYRRLTR